MLKNLLMSFSSTVNERVNSPILGSFIVIWCAVNWRGLYVLIRPLPTAEATIANFDVVTSVWTLYYIPLLVTVIYLLLFPWLHLMYFKYQESPRLQRVVGEYQLLKATLVARKNAMAVQYEIELMKLEREHKLEMKKLETQAELEEEKLEKEYRRNKRASDEAARKRETA